MTSLIAWEPERGVETRGRDRRMDCESANGSENKVGTTNKLTRFQ